MKNGRGNNWTSGQVTAPCPDDPSPRDEKREADEKIAADEVRIIRIVMQVFNHGIKPVIKKLIHETVEEEVGKAVKLLSAEASGQEWFSPSEVARALGKKRETVVSWIKLGIIKAVKSKRKAGPKYRWMVSAEEKRRVQAGLFWPADPTRNSGAVFGLDCPNGEDEE